MNEDTINDLLEKTKNPSSRLAEAIIEKSLKLKGLEPEDVAVLLNCEDGKILNNVLSASRQIKESIYGNRLVLFAPLYLSNKCINECLYCGFRRGSVKTKQRVLTVKEVCGEVKALIAQGHKRLLLVAAENPSVDIDYLEKMIKTVYETRVGHGSIKRVNINVAPMEVKDFRRLKNAGIGTYQIFQETYHRKSYTTLHPSGPKSDFLKRLYACDLAQKAGIDDVGIGVLFGLYDYRFEVLALLFHVKHLENVFGVGPHTISVPRLEPANGSHVASRPPYPVSDKALKKIIAVLRIAVPYTGIILSTRENATLRNELFHLGVSQISAGSKTVPGSYSGNTSAEGQFSIADGRLLAEVIEDLANMGFLPSFCTSCYRTGRTGENFMGIAKPGEIKNFCQPNALLTFEEYLLDYNPKLAQKVKDFLSSEVHKIPDQKIRQMISKKLESIVQGKRDLYF